MAVAPQPAFTVDAATGMPVIATSTRILMPGTVASDGVVRVANLGPGPAAVALGDVTVVAANNTSVVVLAGQVQYLAIPAGATYIAAIAAGGMNTTLNIATGN